MHYRRLRRFATLRKTFTLQILLINSRGPVTLPWTKPPPRRTLFSIVSSLCADNWGGDETAPQKAEQQQRNRGGGGNNGRQPTAAVADTVEDLRRPALRAATILEVEPHPEADSLLLLKVDCGDVGAAV
jgi:hypothetical protein